VDGGAAAFIVYGGLLTALAITLIRETRHRHHGRAVIAGSAAMAVTGSAASYFYSTGPGKRSTWAEVLDELGLHGDEHILDVGCGRGAVLMLAAHRVPKGKTVGVDLWRRRDQSGNSHTATERNAALEGVRERVEVLDGDARDLPCPSGSFDLVVSNLTIHNIRHVDERKQALREAVRVLRPGGRLRIVDFNAERYAEPLRDAGCVDVQVRRLDRRTWFGVPGLVVLVEARIPAD
jgi:SAM-dependent methyltransferase